MLKAMSVSTDDLLQQALTLPDEAKLLLAEELVASVHGVVQEDEALVERRRAEFLSGTAILVSADEALRQVREELAAKSRL